VASPFRTLAGRILFFFLALIVIVQALAFVGIDRARLQSARALITEDLIAGGEAFDRQIQARSDRFFLAARVLSGDLGFKQAFGGGHKPTLLSAMRNHSARLGADVMLIVSLDGRVVADTAAPGAPPSPFPYPALIGTAEREGGASGLVVLGDQLTQVVVFPLLAPAPAAWICLGYRLNDALALELKKLISLDVTFLREDGGDRLEIAASTLGAAPRRALASVLGSARPGPDGTLAVTLNGERHLGYTRELQTLGGARAKVHLLRSLDAALEPFYQVRRFQVFVFASGLIALVAGGAFISATVTTRLRRLAAGAKSVEEGDYTHPIPVVGEDEIGRLSKAFNLMQEAIARREERIRHQACNDDLTGLPNRLGFSLRLEEELAAARARGDCFALIVVDIDRFVAVTAALGYEPGNVVLRQVGALLEAAAPGGSVVARMHADVFAVLVPAGTDVAGAVQVVHGIQARLETPFWIDEVPVQIEASFGIVACPAHGDDADTLLRRADVAAHLAKDAPGGYTVYAPEHDSDSRRHLTLLGELRRAIDRNELTMFFQPKVRFATGRVAGLEALIRWPHAQHGFIPPDEFIGLAEGTGLIKRVTPWTLDAAIGACAALNRRGLALNMAVNLSARSLQDQHLPALVASLVEHHGVPPGQITLELTESAVMADPKGTLAVVSGLAATGVRLAVDDFGTGYSSLSYLQRLPVDELKIDKSFVLRMDRRENDAMIVRTIIELGHNLGLEVTAEGVETQGIWEILKSNGCDLSQGYLHARPMPLSELLVWAEQSPWGLGARA
jgi:diguanylate cyclase (GGDEF)-like protein